MPKARKQYRKASRAKRLEVADPAGRVDVLSYLATKRVVESLEQRYQLPGLWNEVKEDVAGEIGRLLTSKKVEVPPVVMPLLKRFGVIPGN